MYATDVKQTDVRQKHRLMPPPYGGGGTISVSFGLGHSADSDQLHTHTLYALQSCTLTFWTQNHTQNMVPEAHHVN